MQEKFDFYNSTSLKAYNLDDSIRYQLKMLEGLDNVTRKHSENVANITCRLCEKLHCSEGFTIYATTCAYLHDIGKMFIPPRVLQKPSKLTEEEYNIMKTHTTIGYKMCMNDLKLRPYAAGTLYHHESLDGTGYPNGITGDKIPYEAQIIRVADEFEAITAKRQYKTHVGIVDALNILIDHAHPATPKSLSDAGRIYKTGGVGKIDKKIVKALFKVVIDDIEYEIYSRESYVKFLRKEIVRVSDARRFYDRMEAALTPEKREYYREEAKYYLKPNEEPAKIPQMIEELETSYKERKKHIKRLYDEIHEIKRLSI